MSEISVKMDDNWKIYAFKGNLSKEAAKQLKLSCPSEFIPVDLFGSHRNLLSRLIYHLTCIFKGVKLVKRENIDAITQHDAHIENGLIAYVISRLTHRKCVLRVNEDTLIPLIYFLQSSNNSLLKSPVTQKLASVLYRRIENSFFNRVDWIVTHGPMDYEKIKRQTSKISFIPLWVDLQTFKCQDEKTKESFKQKLGIPNNVKVILFVGRLHPEKGIKTLFEALHKIRNMNFLLLMVYSFSQYKEEYELLAKQLGISEKIRFLGFFPNSELPKLYNIADLSVLPSLREQWSNTIMESMACKTPVIATNVGANPYLITDGKTGFLVPPNDSIHLAEKIRLIFNQENSDLITQISENALLEVQKYDKDLVGELYKQTICFLLKKQL
ncbi:MAG: glycosyltransferase family 4 protein [Candidatus Bathyarchaeia archaeon]|jgi:glycosyltransferase involved in cell wall biosynthesis